MTQNAQIIPQVVYLDFDRTLSNNHAIMERFYTVAAFFGITVEAIKHAQHATESDGGTFEPLTLLQSFLNPEEMQKFFKQFITAKTPEILYPDVAEFLKKLEQNNIQYHLITYGVSAAWQELKIKASGYQGEYTIMDHANKGEVIASSVGKDGKYAMPGKDHTIAHANSACLIDDKAVAFGSLPEDCSGFMIQRTKNLLPSQQGELPQHVSRILSLDELTIKDNQLTLK